MAESDRIRELKEANVARIEAGEGAATVVTRDASGKVVLSNARAGAAMEVARTLRPEQQRALELIVMGTDVAGVAKEIGVHRGTVYAWLKKDAVFAAAHNQWLEQLDLEARSRSKMLMRKAGDAVEKALEGGDGRLGLRLLEKMGIVKERAVGPTEAGEVEEERKVAKKKKDLERRKLEAEIKVSEMDPFL